MPTKNEAQYRKIKCNHCGNCKNIGLNNRCEIIEEIIELNSICKYYKTGWITVAESDPRYSKILKYINKETENETSN